VRLVVANIVPGQSIRGLTTVEVGPGQASVVSKFVCRERGNLALEPHFPYRNGRHKAAPALKEYINLRHRKLAMLCSEAQSLFTCSTNPSLPTAIDSDQRSSRRERGIALGLRPFFSLHKSHFLELISSLFWFRFTDPSVTLVRPSLEFPKQSCRGFVFLRWR
jgi:hypothetical protein